MHYHAILMGKASDIFEELKQLEKWERYGIGWKIFSLSIIYSN